MNILIVEDEVGIVDFLKQGLEEEGYVIYLAEDGEQGLELALTKKHDLIILDWMLPKKTGIEICSAIRKQNNEVPIIFLTAKDTVAETIKGLQVGANDYIKKPFSFDELLVRIEVQLRNVPQNKTTLTFGKIELNLATRTVIKDAVPIAFTKKEFDLLAMLMTHKNNICTREAIIKEVWDIHFDYDTSVIDVYINSIRKKLNFKVENNGIKTVRGVGYIMEEL